MTIVRELLAGILAAGVTLELDADEGVVRCTPTGILPEDLARDLESNLCEVAIWFAVSQVIDPDRLGVLLLWMAENRTELYEVEEDAGLRLGAAWVEGQRVPFFNALGRWVAILEQAASEAAGEPSGLKGKTPVWCWWTRYTPRTAGFQDQPAPRSPLTEFFAAEVGLPDDDEADVVLHGADPIGSKGQDVPARYTEALSRGKEK